MRQARLFFSATIGGYQPQRQPSHLQSPQLHVLLSAQRQSSHAQSSQAQTAAAEPQSPSPQAQSSHLQTPQQQPSLAWLADVVETPQRQALRADWVSPALEARPTPMISVSISFMWILRRTPQGGRSIHVQLRLFIRAERGRAQNSYRTCSARLSTGPGRHRGLQSADADQLIQTHSRAWALRVPRSVNHGGVSHDEISGGP